MAGTGQEGQSGGVAIFDLDGTLVDSRADLATAVNRARAAFGLPPLPLSTIVAAIGDGQRRLVEIVIPEAVAPLDERVAAVRRAYADCLLDTTTLYPGVRATLSALRRSGWRLAVATNKAAAATEAVLRGLKVCDLFDAVVGAEEGLPLKPDPAPLLLALKRAGADRATPRWMVGDNHTDLAAARRAGMLRCYCRYGFGDPGAEGWDLVIDDPRSLARHLLP